MWGMVERLRWDRYGVWRRRRSKRIHDWGRDSLVRLVEVVGLNWIGKIKGWWTGIRWRSYGGINKLLALPIGWAQLCDLGWASVYIRTT